MSAVVKQLQFWLFLLYCSYLSLTPSPSETLTETFSDKFLHCAGYLLLLVSFNIAFRPNRQLLLKIIILFAYSTAIEIAQHIIPNRGFSFGDMFANLTGLMIGAGFLALFSLAKKRIVRHRT